MNLCTMNEFASLIFLHLCKKLSSMWEEEVSSSKAAEKYRYSNGGQSSKNDLLSFYPWLIKTSMNMLPFYRGLFPLAVDG